MKSAQASQAKQENDTIKRSALVPEDCGGLREGRKDRQQVNNQSSNKKDYPPFVMMIE